MSINDFGGLPLVMGSVRGVRAFDLDSLGRLRGISYSQVWTPGENVSVHGGDKTVRIDTGVGDPVLRTIQRQLRSSLMTIEESQGKAHLVPDDYHAASCKSCGFYAYYGPEGENVRTDRVTAVVEGYGVVHVGTKGFRAEKSRIIALCSPRSKKTMSRAGWRFDWLARILHRKGWGDGAPLAAMPSVLAGVGAALTLAAGLWWLAMPLILLALFSAYVTVSGFRAIKYDFPSIHNLANPFEGDDIQLLQRNYPDVPIFRSMSKMLAAFPPDQEKAPVISPDTDPDFWTRSI